MTTPRPDSRVGTDLGPYRIERVLGRGGMGVVYLAEQPNLGRRVALKVLPAELAGDVAFRARFERESKMAAAIDDPNILPVYEAGEIEGVLFIAMRYVEGTDLEARLRGERLEPRTAIHLLGQIASALDAAHAQGLVHRDVKPGNILVARGHGDERGEHAYLADFGLTKSRGVDTSLTRAGTLLGTLDYMAPEELEGRDLDGAADQYALAAIAFRALTGHLPFERDSDVAVISAHLQEAPPSARSLAATLPAAVDAVLARGMAKDPGERYPSCTAFMADLGAALGTEPATMPRSATAHGIHGLRRWAAMVVGVGLILVAAAAIGSRQGSSTSLIASPSPSQSGEQTSMASPTSDASAFPDEAEATLLTKVPADLRDRCVRGERTPIIGELARSTTPLASLRCTAGNFAFVIKQLDPGGLSAGDILRRVSEAWGLPAGDCEVATPALGPWFEGDREVGSVACYLRGVDAVIEWTYEEEGLFARATVPYGDVTSAVSWWLDTRDLIGSTQLGVQAPFPGPAESALIRMLPVALSGDCGRGSYSRPARALPVKPIASIRCPLPRGPGATVLELRQISDVEDVTASDVLAAKNIAPGGCPPPSRPDGRWSIAERDTGAIACYKDNLPNSIIEWSYDDAGILARALRPGNDSLAMFAWWQANAPTLVP